MRKSKSIVAVLSAALMVFNITCACASSAAMGESENSNQSSHHDSVSKDSSSNIPCAHQNCDGCDELRDTCDTPDYTVVSAERDCRVAPLTNIDLDSNDLDSFYAGADPPWHPLTPQTNLPPDSIVAVLLHDTPIYRKDRLIE